LSHHTVHFIFIAGGNHCHIISFFFVKSYCTFLRYLRDKSLAHHTATFYVIGGENHCHIIPCLSSLFNMKILVKCTRTVPFLLICHGNHCQRTISLSNHTVTYCTFIYLLWQSPSTCTSVADPDPGSDAFLTPGSGIGFFRIPDPKPVFLRA
jgi:hypothetical protein